MEGDYKYLRKLPRKGLVADFGMVELDQLVEFSSTDFYDLHIFELQMEHIKNRSEELNAHLVIYHIGSNEVAKSDTYLMKFVGEKPEDAECLLQRTIGQPEEIDLGIGMKQKEVVNLVCMVCGEVFQGEEPKMCCSGMDCACRGMPVDPIICSEVCYNNLPFKKQKNVMRWTA